MINQHDINDMLPTMAQRLVRQSSGVEVPEAALPSLVKFMQEVARECADLVDAGGSRAAAERIIDTFKLDAAPCFLLKKKKPRGGRGGSQMEIVYASSH
jgi:hypothetical protein